LGWLDAEGKPVNQSVRVSYSRLQKEANVSPRAIPKAIKLANACNFIKCIVAPSPDQFGLAGTAGEYTLNWDESGAFESTLSEFNGFYTGEGNRSPIPNSFFDTVVPNESLSVTKVVGAVLRHTIGYQNQFGGRRMIHPLSCSMLQNFTGISDRKTVIAAIRRSIEAGFIERVVKGEFHSDSNIRKTAVYGVKWLIQNKIETTTAKTPPVSDDGKNPTRTTAKSPPANHGKNPTSIEITKPKDISKQQAAVDLDSETKQRLLAAGFDEATAKKLITERGVAVTKNQLDWIDARKPKNRLAMLRKAIEEDWTEPASFAVKQKLAATRQREAIHNAAQLSEEVIVNQQKAERKKRKKRLLAQWQLATQSQRAAWISLAAKRQTAKSLQQIIARQSPSTEKPHAQVLDQVAVSADLPALTLEPSAAQSASVAKQPKSQPAPSATDSNSNTAGTPQKEKPPTEMVSF
jgi:hypothetical protein